MVFTNVGRSGASLLLGPSGGSYPRFVELDAGSQSVSVATSGVNSVYLERGISTFDQGIEKEITYTTDWNSVELSGTTCYGFGLKAGSDLSGTDWVVENFASTGSINFDGNKELQIQITLKNI